MPVKTVRESTVGKVALRVLQTTSEYIGLHFEGGRETFRTAGQTVDVVWDELQSKLTRDGPNWLSYAGARARFLHWFRDGFHSLAYLDAERDYKLKAKADLEKTVPAEIAPTGSGHGEAVLRAYRATNLLYPVEKTRMQGLLRGADGDAFIRSAARFALGEGRPALRAMEALLRPYDNARWTVVTYLPFLWRPETHIFLKPEVTKDFAERVGHDLSRRYRADLELSTYEGLLDLARGIGSAFADLEPRDMIDVQSVIWVVGDYRDGRETPQP